MLNKIIHFSLQNRILVLVASVLLLIGGTYTAMHTEVDVLPTCTLSRGVPSASWVLLLMYH